MFENQFRQNGWMDGEKKFAPGEISHMNPPKSTLIYDHMTFISAASVCHKNSPQRKCDICEFNPFLAKD